ncbi:MAG: hypothetical protein N3A58_02790 [Spirochaetes bacterium]|nr:hypothetical protein [Spirochaetota bacterium]
MKKKYYYYVVFLFFVILFFSLFINISSCKLKNKGGDESLLVGDDEGEKIFIVEQSDQYQNINWDEEMKKLQGIGKIPDVPTYCTIIAIIAIELRKVEDEILAKNISQEEKNNLMLKKRDELLKYFNISQEELDDYYEKNKVMIENFIITHNAFRKAIEVE